MVFTTMYRLFLSLTAFEIMIWGIYHVWTELYLLWRLLHSGYSLAGKNRSIGKWGRMHRDYIKGHNPIRFNDLCISGELWTYLADLNEQAQRPSWTYYRATESCWGRDGGLEAARSDGMGRCYEQHPKSSRGNHFGWNNLTYAERRPGSLFESSISIFHVFSVLNHMLLHVLFILDAFRQNVRSFYKSAKNCGSKHFESFNIACFGPKEKGKASLFENTLFPFAFYPPPFLISAQNSCRMFRFRLRS